MRHLSCIAVSCKSILVSSTISWNWVKTGSSKLLKILTLEICKVHKMTPQTEAKESDESNVLQDGITDETATP